MYITKIIPLIIIASSSTNVCAEIWSNIGKVVQTGPLYESFGLHQTKLLYCLQPCVSNSPRVNKHFCYLTIEGVEDRCNPNTTVEWIKNRAWTAHNGPCKDECRSINGKYRCNHYWAGNDTCNPQVTYDYIQSQTVLGKLCRGPCKRHGRLYQTCLDINRKDDFCAHPAVTRRKRYQLKVEPNRWHVEPTIYLNETTTETEATKKNVTHLLELARQIEEDPRMVVRRLHFLNNTHNAITKYTIKDVSGKTWPYVIRATIRPKHLSERNQTKTDSPTTPKTLPKKVGSTKPKKSPLINDDPDRLDLTGRNPYRKKNPYIASHLPEFRLIPESIGGPKTDYNTLPRMEYSVHRGIYNNTDLIPFEDDIRRFLKSNADPKVVLTVVVIYQDEEEDPLAVAWYTLFYSKDVLQKQAEEFVIKDERVWCTNSTDVPIFVTPDRKFLGIVDGMWEDVF